MFSRLERLQRVVGKVQMESGLCDEQLSHLESLLQTVSPLSNSLLYYLYTKLQVIQKIITLSLLGNVTFVNIIVTN